MCVCVCVAGRLFVERGIHDEFLDRMVCGDMYLVSKTPSALSVSLTLGGGSEEDEDW